MLLSSETGTHASEALDSDKRTRRSFEVMCAFDHQCLINVFPIVILIILYLDKNSDVSCETVNQQNKKNNITADAR